MGVSKRNGNEHRPGDKRLSLAPLNFDEALEGLLQAGPHPQETQDTKEPAPPKVRRPRKVDRAPKQ